MDRDRKDLVKLRKQQTFGLLAVYTVKQRFGLLMGIAELQIIADGEWLKPKRCQTLQGGVVFMMGKGC